MLPTELRKIEDLADARLLKGCANPMIVQINDATPRGFKQITLQAESRDEKVLLTGLAICIANGGRITAEPDEYQAESLVFDGSDTPIKPIRRRKRAAP
jgi:hypothetical protein